MELSGVCPICNSDKDILSETHKLLLELLPLKSERNPSCSELALDIKELMKGSGKVSDQETNHFRVTILGLNEKLKMLDLYQAKAKQYKDQFHSSVLAQEQIHTSVQDSLSDIENRTNNFNLFMDNVYKERNQLQTQLNLQANLNQEKSKEIEHLNTRIKHIENECHLLRIHNKNFNEMQDMLEALQGQVREKDKMRDDIRNQYKESLVEFQKIQSDLECENKLLSKENKEIGEKLNQTRNIVRALENIKNEHISQIDKLNSQISFLESKINAISDQASKSASMEKLASSHNSKVQILSKKIEKISEKYSIQVQNLEKDSKEKSDKLSLTNKEKKILTENNINLEQKTKLLCHDKMELKEKLDIVEQKLCMQEDTFSIIDMVQELHVNSQENVQSLLEDLEECSNFIISLSFQNLANQRVSAKLKSLVKDKKREIKLMQEMINELQKLKKYFPVKDDPIDVALAEYLNSRAESLEVPFVREDQGVYLYGTKRVFMKMEAGKIIIRVGGGYMHIDEFISIYSAKDCESKEYRSKTPTKIQKKRAIKEIKKVMSGVSIPFTPIQAIPRLFRKKSLKRN